MSMGVNNDMFSGHSTLGISETRSFSIIVLFSLCMYIGV